MHRQAADLRVKRAEAECGGLMTDLQFLLIGAFSYLRVQPDKSPSLPFSFVAGIPGSGLLVGDFDLQKIKP
jgi:hypothetical protein